MSKILVLWVEGLDNKNNMSSLKKIQSKSIWGSLDDNCPNTFPAMFVAAESGLNPEQHGCTGNKPVELKRMKEIPQLWNILTKKMQRVSLVDVPVFPVLPEIPAGYSFKFGASDQETDGIICKPESLKNDIKKLVGNSVSLNNTFNIIEYLINERGSDYTVAYVNIQNEHKLFDEKVGEISGKIKDDVILYLIGINTEKTNTLDFLLTGKQIPAAGEVKGSGLTQFAPTVLELMGISIPQTMKGRSLLSLVKADDDGNNGAGEKMEERVMSRLENLGY